jgi:hypothetical protein
MPPQCSRTLQRESSRQVNLDSRVVPIDATMELRRGTITSSTQEILAATPLTLHSTERAFPELGIFLKKRKH